MVELASVISSEIVGEPIQASLLGGEFLGWTGLPGFRAQAEIMSIGHLRWPGGINAEDRIDIGGYAYDLSTSNVVDNWETWNGAPKAGLEEVMGFAQDQGMSFSMIVPTARYVEAAADDLDAALAWLSADLQVFTWRLATGHFGEVPPLTLEVGAEYYSTNSWESSGGSQDTLDLFSQIFSHAVSELVAAEKLYGEMYDIAVQSGRFQSRDDPLIGYRNGEAADSMVFLQAYRDAGVLEDIDALIWHRYTRQFYQIDDAFRQQIHFDNEMSTLLPDHVDFWEGEVGRDLDLVVSWLSPDIDSSGTTDNPAFDHGPQSAHNILQMFSEIAASGADIATVYGMDIQWPGSLSYGSADNPDIYFGGKVYELIVESVEGLAVSDLYHANALPTDAQNAILEQDYVSFFSFESTARSVFFAAAGDLASETLPVALKIHEPERFKFAQITRLIPEGEGAFATAEKVMEAPIDFTRDTFIFDFHDDFEVVRVEFFDTVPGPNGIDPVELYHGQDGELVYVVGTSEDHPGFGDQFVPPPPPPIAGQSADEAFYFYDNFGFV